MRELTRRKFLVMTGATATAAAIAAACGDDDADLPATSAPPNATPGLTPSTTVSTDAAAAAIKWYGQSMFLLTSPGGAMALLDPFVDIGYTLPPPLNSDVATITHEHPDHNNSELAGTRARLLRGLTPDGYADIDEIVGEIRIKTVRAFHDTTQGMTFGRNSLFVFETAGLRLAHLGDLGHQLDETQIAAMGGPVDVLMVPVGGSFTIDAGGATELVAALQPKIVFPMHYKTARTTTPIATVDAFLEGKTVERVGSTTIRLSRDSLPAETTVMVLDYE